MSGTLTTSVSQSSNPGGTSTTSGVTLDLSAPVGSGAVGGSFGQSSTSTPGGKITGSSASVWGTVQPTQGVSVTGSLGTSGQSLPGGVTSSTSSLGLRGTAGNTTLDLGSSHTSASIGSSSQTISGTLTQNIPIGDKFGLSGSLGQAHTTGTSGTYNTTSMGISGTAEVGGGTASLGFNKANTSGTGGFRQTEQGVKLSFEKPIGGGATIGGFVTTGSSQTGSGPSIPSSGGGISVSCSFGNYSRP